MRESRVSCTKHLEVRESFEYKSLTAMHNLVCNELGLDCQRLEGYAKENSSLVSQAVVLSTPKLLE